ncbi:superoxide dismutase [Thermoflavimicrobium daqui]|uniref:Superoxide dismutase [Cu-Zn] n=2 Tax=Thermoflavimicrobium daqui TaxID=2137476 RepID=A0A364K4M3_9BACL|nr:superoxide dismutase [Thermoflavimicrobium daqui]
MSLAIALCWGMSACSSTSATTALAELVNTQGKKVGTIELKQVSEGVELRIAAEQLPPGSHGFHIHEIGKCEVPHFKSAGGHFNPTDKKHGKHSSQGAHAGDLENLVVDSQGKVTKSQVITGVTLEKGKAQSLLKDQGTALVIHEKADDYKTDPAGDSGSRIACGVIKAK